MREGEKALTLCMPVTVKTRKNDVPDEGEEEPVKAGKRTIFVYKNRWFVLSQTEGEPYQPQELPTWSEERALSTLSISRIPFTHLDGNTQGYAPINP